MIEPRLTACLKTVSLLSLAISAHAAFAAAPDATPEVPKLGAVPASALTPATAVSDPATAVDRTEPGAFAPVAAADPAGPDPRQVECVAKVILHEAGSLRGAGQIAVAQVIRARVKSGRFAADACGVVKQRGQFFDVDAYNPARDTGAWRNAAAIAADALSDIGEPVAPGALFFHAAYSSRGMANRVKVAAIGGNVFYR